MVSNSTETLATSIYTITKLGERKEKKSVKEKADTCVLASFYSEIYNNVIRR